MPLPKLSKKEEEQVEFFAQRHANFILSMEEANRRMREVPKADLSELYGRIMNGPENQVHVERADAEVFLQDMEEKVCKLRQGTTPEDAMLMLKWANAGAMTMNNYMAFDQPRLKRAVARRMTVIHHTAVRERLKEEGLLLEDGRVKIGPDQVSAKPIGNFRGFEDNNTFEPSDSTRSLSRVITFADFKSLPLKDLLTRTFFFRDYDPVPGESNLCGFKITGRKENLEGFFYEVLYEGTSDAMDVGLDELEGIAENGLWIAPAE